MTRAHPVVLPFALLLATCVAAPARIAGAQPGTPGQGSALAEPVPAPGSTTETLGDTEAVAPPAPEPTPEATPIPSPTGPTVAAEPTPTPEPSPTLAPVAPAPEEEEEAEEDRVRLFYVEAAIGYTWIDLGQFRTDNLSPDVVRIQGSGFGAEVGAGLALGFLTLGLEGDWSRYTDFDLGTVALDVGFRLPVPVVEPYFRVGLGYSWVLNVDEAGTGAFPTGVEGIQGLVGEAGAGVYIALNDVLSFNVGLDAAVLGMKRRSSSIDDFGDPDFLPDEDGEAVGLKVSLLAGVNLQF